ncbi:ABC transporter permease [Bradyrhizobium sp. BWA-3-5]|uniref:ABC transporter permease n=1 Tax=Bradyrhizobium sp. BWA-3-5 TaxID=3080013 RepID=UPI00293F4E7A|nr:ABC transporter permease [Bradyrhizobium sp. BWA-3-5]WOH68180.1 ABC transporter permease [Bradyrhizobium sp. BWA-3-5]
MSWLKLYGPRLFNAVKHDIQQRYAGSVLGSFWAILYPLFMVSFYATVYVVIFRIRVPSLSPEVYTVLVMSGLSAVLMFSESISAGLGAIVNQRSLLLNTVFPAELLPPRSVLASQVPSLVALMFASIAAVFLRSASPVAILVVPMTWILLIMFLIGLVWIFSLIALVLRDIQQGVNIINMSMMVLSPMAYTPDMVPSALKFIIWLNPISYFILCLQAPLALGSWPSPAAMIGAICLGIGTFLVGLTFFRRARFAFVDYA